MKPLRLIVAFLSVLFISFSTNGQTTSSPKLKAILIVGPQEDGTDEAITEMDKTANTFTQNNVEVYKYYNQKAVWKNIVEKAKDCNFLVYSGHGTTLGENDKPGGFCLTEMVSVEKIQSELRLKPNSMVIFKSVCMGAGSSASDTDDIGIKEAQFRVESYASSFDKTGAVGYYANNYDNGAVSFLIQFFKGKSIADAYKYVAESYCTIELDTLSSINKTKRIAIATSPGGGVSTVTTYTDGVKSVKSVKTIKSAKGYEVAFVGKKEYCLKELLNSTK